MLENVSYCPVLFTRVSEIKALAQLPASSKLRTFPLLIARPWPNAKELAKTWEKIEEAFGGHSYGIDLDTTKRGARPGQAASDEFDGLFSPDNGFARYYEQVSQLPRAVPVFQRPNHSLESEGHQIENIRALDRGIIVRFSYGDAQPALDALRRLVGEIDDIVVFVDAGWSRDLLGRELWASQLVAAVGEISERVEIVVSGSSFPDSFTGVSGRGTISMEERALFANLMRRHNAAPLIYGDWGSTRPPLDPVPMQSKPRLDLPLLREWVCFRQEDGEGYEELASRMIADPLWPQNLNIWGTYIVATTAEGLPGGIRSASAAAAARINIHLHRQAQFDQPLLIGDGDEPYTDD